MLDGIRIIDLTRLLPGPYATWLLAGMGAEVIKVEQPGRGDYIRSNWPRREGTATVFHLFNRGKRLMAADLKSEEGKAALWDLLASAHVLIEGFRPGVMDRLGFGFDDVQARLPGIVYCSLTGFGHATPYATRVGHDINYLSIAGLQDGLRDEGGHPVPSRFQIADMAGGALTAVVGVLGALRAAERTGRGRHVDASMTDAVFPFQGLRLAEELIPGDDAPTGWVAGEGHDKELGAYRTRDGGFITLDPYEVPFKGRLWTLIEEHGLGPRPREDASREDVRSRLKEVVAARDRGWWEDLLTDEEVCFAPVLTLDELPDEPHVASRGLLGDSMDPEVASPTLGFPLQFDPPLDPPSARAVEIGAETAAILEELGWEETRIAAAEKVGAIRTSRSS